MQHRHDEPDFAYPKMKNFFEILKVANDIPSPRAPKVKKHRQAMNFNSFDCVVQPFPYAALVLSLWWYKASQPAYIA
jgi:hypothetical protein